MVLIAATNTFLYFYTGLYNIYTPSYILGMYCRWNDGETYNRYILRTPDTVWSMTISSVFYVPVTGCSVTW